MSTSCVHPWSTERAFAMAKQAGYDGVEVMVSRDRGTRDALALSELAERYDLPILSVHAPVLLLTHFVWGRDPQVKLERSAALAQAVGAASVVVHPPFRWQGGYAERFLEAVAETSGRFGVTVAVENMFPWTVRGRSLPAYSPGWDPLDFDCEAVTLDFSHAALSGRDGLDMAVQLGPRLRHVHLCDGSEGAGFDEHLPPGEGSQPIAETLAWLAETGWDGSIVAEVNTRRLRTEEERLDVLRATLDYARLHTTTVEPATPSAAE